MRSRWQIHALHLDRNKGSCYTAETKSRFAISMSDSESNQQCIIGARTQHGRYFLARLSCLLQAPCISILSSANRCFRAHRLLPLHAPLSQVESSSIAARARWPKNRIVFVLHARSIPDGLPFLPSLLHPTTAEPQLRYASPGSPYPAGTSACLPPWPSTRPYG